MAEPSLLCVNCTRPPPPHRRTWGRCIICVERNLPSTYYCGEECMNAHWPKHKVYHKMQKELAEQRREGTLLESDRSAAEEAARVAEETGSEFSKRFAAAMAFSAQGDYHAEAKAWRKIIKQWPGRPTPYFNLANTLQRSVRLEEAAPMFLKAMELYEGDGSVHWAHSAAAAFTVLKHPDCDEVPKPEWWNDEALKALSARVVVVVPDGPHRPLACGMRAVVLSGEEPWSGDAEWEPQWNVGPRTAAEIKEAATWYWRASELALTPAHKLRDEDLARQCDAVADPLLAEEAAEAAKARVAAEDEAAEALKAAEAKAAEALKVAEAKAKVVAEELLAEEEQEKQAASKKASKAKQGKGKKGKSNR